MVYIGIDPGLSGGIAFVTADGEADLAIKMPATERDILDVLRTHVGSHATRPCRAILEFVRAMPKQGVSSTFKFGMGYGALRMALVATEIPFDEVTPQKWQGALGCRTGGDKNVSKRRAQELFPQVKVTHALADALLIAEYGRRLHMGLLTRPAAVGAPF